MSSTVIRQWTAAATTRSSGRGGSRRRREDSDIAARGYYLSGDTMALELKKLVSRILEAYALPLDAIHGLAHRARARYFPEFVKADWGLDLS